MYWIVEVSENVNYGGWRSYGASNDKSVCSPLPLERTKGNENTFSLLFLHAQKQTAQKTP